MFDIGFQELIIIFVVALLVVGPEKLPEFSRTLGKWVKEIRLGIEQAKFRMENEVSMISEVTETSLPPAAEREKDPQEPKEEDPYKEAVREGRAMRGS